MKLLYTILIFFILPLATNAEEIIIAKGQYECRSRTQTLKQFAVSKGDVVTIRIEAQHKKRGIDLIVKQHPGNIILLDFEELNNGSKRIVAQADAIWEVLYGGERVSFNVHIINSTSKPNGPKRGDIVYVQIPDTMHASGYVNRLAGQSYSLEPYKEKVVLGTTVQSETICNRDFFTGVDKIRLSIPGDSKEEYREQKLLSYNISLVCQSPEVYKAMLGVVDEGIDAFVKMPEFSGNKSKKVNKMSHKNRYEFTDKLDKRTEQLETATELVSLGDEAATELAPGSGGADALSTAAFIMDTDGMKQMALQEGLKTAGAPEEMMSIMGAIEEVPSATDLVKDGFHAIAPKVKGKANIKVEEKAFVKKSYYQLPQGEIWIQSAKTYGSNDGYWDIPGKPTASSNGQKMEVFSIDGGIDRRFKLVPSSEHKGYYYIVTAQPGDKERALDHKGGSVNTWKQGNRLHLWDKHGGTSQLFRFQHMGNGRVRIFNFDGYAISLQDKSANNKKDVLVAYPQDGAHFEWFLIDPSTKTAQTPTEVGTTGGWINFATVWETGGAINKTIEVSKMEDPLYLNEPSKQIAVFIDKFAAEAKAKLMIEAKYRITDYTDVIKYKRNTIPVKTKDFWTAYKVNYRYAIMFADQAQAHYKKMSKHEYNNTARPTTEALDANNPEQVARFERYKILTAKPTQKK